MSNDELPLIAFESTQEWAAWLEEQPSSSHGIWLKIAKKGSGIRTIPYAEALDTALCYGWIDGQKAKLDDQYWLQRFTPRKPRSRWSQVNRLRALKLIEQGEMKPAGLREVERAAADGRWDAAYAPQSASSVPEDLQRELDNNPGAAEFFSTLDSASRYSILYGIQDAKLPKTRARRIQQYVQMLSKHRKPHEQGG